MSQSLQFPPSPVLGQIFAQSGITWRWDGAVWTSVQLVAGSPIGAVMDWSGTTEPPGWLFCDGRLLDRQEYELLFLVLGETFGAGDGVATFALPDYRGRVSVGADMDNGAGPADVITILDVSVLGTYGGSEWYQAHGHALNDPGHSHSAWDNGHSHGVSDPTHAHGLADPGHSHGIGDPGHAHAQAHAASGGLIQAPTTVYFMISTGWNDMTSGVGTGIWTGGSGTGMGVYGASTGIWNDTGWASIGIGGSGTGITLDNAGDGDSQNLQPFLVTNKIIYTGVM